jgi:peptidoglycan/xylan/chitin deacetylase (PgdA/CDA1 family)
MTMARTVALRLALATGVVAAALLGLLAVTTVDADEPHAGPAKSAGPATSAVPSAPRPSREPVPILMYHAIRTPPADARLPSIFVRPRDFAAQIRALRGAHYTAVTLQRVWDAWHGRATLPRSPIVLSFDDGYPSQAKIALPILRREGWPGVMNLTLDYIDDLGGDDAVRRMIAGGWEIDAHTRTHPDLTQASDSQLADETAAARAELTRRFGVAANFFCYPAGRFDARVVAAVRKAGYLAATTVRLGLAQRSAPFTLARVSVDGRKDAAALLHRLRALRSRAASA